MPFSDPMADGPTIAEAGRVALAAGGGLPSARAAGRRACASAGTTQPLMVMSYLNPLLAAGEHATLRALRAAGADGLIVPDLPAGAAAASRAPGRVARPGDLVPGGAEHAARRAWTPRSRRQPGSCTSCRCSG